jgi:hypothetical protein
LTCNGGYKDTPMMGPVLSKRYMTCYSNCSKDVKQKGAKVLQPYTRLLYLSKWRYKGILEMCIVPIASALWLMELCNTAQW